MLEQKIVDNILKTKNENRKCNYCFIENILKWHLFITKLIEKNISINHGFLGSRNVSNIKLR